VRLLVDSNALIRAADQPALLAPGAKSALVDPSNQLLISAATIWEISIKVGLKKLVLSLPYKEWINQAIADLGLSVLPISVDYANLQMELPMHHRDPFDRLIIAQAMLETLSIVSSDEMIARYGVNRIWD